MNTQEIKRELHQMIDNADERFLRLVHSMATAYKSEEDFTEPGKPMDTETYKKRISNARKRVKAGYFTSQQDLEKEIEEW